MTKRFAVRAAHWMLVAAATLAGCGGGGDSGAPERAPATAAVPTPAEAEGRKVGQAVFVPPNIPQDAHTRGTWSPVYNWPLIPLHLVMLADGRLMSYGSNGDGTQTGKFIYDIWDPEGGLGGGHLTISKSALADIFCSTQLVLPSTGQVFVGGGDNWTGTNTTNTGNNSSNVFTPSTNTLAATSNSMNRPRWYATSTTLLNGETLIHGGLGGADRPEIRAVNGNFRLLSTADTSGLDWTYPRNFIAPDGRLFGYDTWGRMYYMDVAGTGGITNLSMFNWQYAGSDSTAAMFRPGRILQFGGNSNLAAVIDIRGATPVFTPTQSLASQRRLVTGTILADGKVLATGGSATYNEMVGVAYSADIWNPDTGTWTVGASGARARLYHSVAMLMPDASVLVGGGGAPGPQNNTNIEIYFPPYLFSAGGVLAARPGITAAPTVTDIGRTFRVQVDNGAGIGRVVMVKTGSVTHSFNMEQRFIELSFTRNGNELSVQAPIRAADAPPGYYMVFVLNSAGVPSVAKIVKMNVAATPNPSITPTLTNPGARSTPQGSSTSLQLVASDPNGDVLGYGATGLPPGLTINGSTGLISGAPTAVGSYNVVVAASDGINSATASFVWTVTGAAGMTIALGAAPTAVQTGTNATFTASSANGINPRYKWAFGDGTPETAYSTSPTATHAYASPGLYSATLTAIDDRGIEQRVSFVQSIYLPPTAQKPTASTNMTIEPRSGANARLWVVNQDNDSVSVFDAVTRAKLAEIAVGTAPRTIALAPNGMLWVANKQSATLSVIDPGTLSVNRTISLPRASQPFGVAMSAGGAFALVALEATGQVLKFNTSSYAQTGSADVGGNPRHLAISGDGATAYVSRFVTAPLAGEGTAVVNPGSGGAQVVRLAPAAMTVQGSTVLAHSDRVDAENQGSGVPNYLGAAALSPDGSQAWVPSKQDNIQRGTLRNGLPLNFQNTVRAISSRIVLANHQEDLAGRIDHDNASLASAALFDPTGIYLFVALETSREVAVVDAHGRREMMRFDVGRAPQGLAVSADGNTLFVSNFMDRSVGVFDLRPLRDQGLASVPAIATVNAVATEKLGATVLLGKRLFYDARDARLARDRYMSCASCHSDGGHDGRVWDLTGFGEGLRNTVNLRGRAGMGQGMLHWSNNFNEVQDFEGQIRNLAGGTGLMSDAQFNTGTRSQPLGDAKAGLSNDLDALAAYVASLNQFDLSPARNADGSLTASGAAGATVFSSSCASCHSGAAFTDSTARNIGTLKPSSGSRLGAALGGIDTPTLRDVWATAPYLHDGSAPTIEAAVQAHNGLTLAAADLTSVAAYVRQIGREEAGPAAPPGAGVRYVRLVALSEINGNAWTTMAEFNLLDTSGATVSRTGWQVSVDSAEPAHPATSAIDGVPTIWHTQWQTASPPPPHTFTVVMPTAVQVGGFRYLPQQGTNPNGTIANWRFETSADGVAWSVAGTGTFTWTGGINAEKTVLFGAPPPNQPPTLAAVAARSNVVNQATTFTLTGSDPNGDTLAYAATGLPTGLALNATTGVIGGTPTTVANHTVTATVSDGRGGTASQSFTWAITAASQTNQPPTLAAVADRSDVVNQVTTFTLTGGDPDGDTLAYAATGLPAGLTIHAGTGVISGTPTTTGTSTVTATVDDGRGGVATRAFAWTISAAPSVGTGLTGNYFNNVTLAGAPVLTRVEAVNFSWGSASPGTGVNTNNFSARWTGTVATGSAGAYRFRTVSDQGVRVWVDNVLVIDNWTAHTSATDTSGAVNLLANQRYPVTVEYYDNTGTATMQLRWRVPGATGYVALPPSSLFAN